MKRVFFKSIRFQIILLYLLILACTLTLLRLGLYFNFRDTLQTDLDAKLQLKGNGIEDSIRTYWQTEKLNKPKEFTNQDFFLRTIANLNKSLVG